VIAVINVTTDYLPERTANCNEQLHKSLLYCES